MAEDYQTYYKKLDPIEDLLNRLDNESGMARWAEGAQQGGQIEDRRSNFPWQALLATVTGRDIQATSGQKSWPMSYPLNPTEGQSSLASELGYGNIPQKPRYETQIYRPGKSDLEVKRVK